MNDVENAISSQSIAKERTFLSGSIILYTFLYNFLYTLVEAKYET